MNIGINKIGIVVCNYNKSEYVKNCVASLLEQTYADRDIYVVDNASTDDSVQVLKECYGDRITIMQNQENLGGAGGFGCGTEYCMEQGYPYIMLVDNDTRFDANAIEIMYRYLENHEDVGMCGAGILQMKNPVHIQEIGSMIDWQSYGLKPNYSGEKLSDQIPETVDCDVLPACALLVRSEVIKKIGVMRKDYFVYWDDIEWCRRCLDAGWRLVALRDAHVWHNWSARVLTKSNAFTEYYGRRNKLRFFATYVEDGEIASFIENALRNMFNILYGHYKKGALEEMKASLYALDDFIHGVWGKVPMSKISVEHPAELPLEKILRSREEVYLLPNEQMGNDEGIADIEAVIRFCNPDIRIIVQETGVVPPENAMCIKPCNHVTRVRENILPVVQVDRFLNCIAEKEDYDYFQNYENAYGLFRSLYEPLMWEGIRKIRNGSKILR